MNNINYKKASTYYLVGSFFNKGIAFLTIPIFTRILSTYDYGIVTTYNSWVTIVSMFMGLALHIGIRVAYVDFKEKFDDYTATTISFTMFLSAVLIGLVMVLSEIFEIDVSSLLIFLCMLQSFATAVIQDYNYYLMMQYRYKFRTALMIMPNLLSTLCSAFVIMFITKTNMYMGRIVPTVIINLGFAVVIVVIALSQSKHIFKMEYLKYGLKVSTPLILHGISLNILSQSDRTMITMLADAAQTGIYSLIYNFGMLASVITSSLEGVWVPWFFSRLEKKEHSEIHKMAKNYINLMTYVMGCLILVAPEIVKLLADKNYWEGISIIPPVILANYAIFIYTLYVNIEHFYKKTIYITCNTVIAAIVNVVLNFIFIPRYGYVAAAYTTLVSYFVSFILHSRYAKKLEPDLYPIKTFIRPILHLLVMTIVFYCLVEQSVIRWILMLVYLLMMLIKERKQLFELFPEIEKRLIKKN